MTSPDKILTKESDAALPADALYNTATAFHFECEYASGVQMIAVERGRKLPASDPRKHGSARAE